MTDEAQHEAARRLHWELVQAMAARLKREGCVRVVRSGVRPRPNETASNVRG